MTDKTAKIYEFEGFRLDMTERLLVRSDGERVQLSEKAFETLGLLVTNAGHLISKDEFFRKVWSDSVVEENNLNKNIFALRRSLGETQGEKPRFIETVKKHGFRFVAPVTIVMPETVVARRDQRRTFFVASICLVILSAVTVSYLFYINVAGAGIGQESKSIAVLLPKPLDPSSRTDIYEIGIADAVINRLGAMKGLRARPLMSIQKYLDNDMDAVAIGIEQKADYVLTSTYLLANGRVRFTSQLINVASGQVEAAYQGVEQDTKNVFATHDIVADEIRDVLISKFSTVSIKPAGKSGTKNEEAYRLYLHGKNLSARQSIPDARKAIENFENAIRLDPNYAAAHAGLANAYLTSGLVGAGPARVENEKAKVAVNTALALDNSLSEAFSVRGNVNLIYEWDFPSAQRDLIRAIELAPNNDQAHWIYALALAYQGRFDEALVEMDGALAINPGSLMYQRDRGRILYFARRYDEAIAQLKRAVELDPRFDTTPIWVRLAYEMKGDEGQAFEWFIKDQRNMNPDRVELFQKIHESDGWQAVRRQHLEFLKQDQGKPNRLWVLARQAAQLGENDLAFECLNKGVENRQWQMVMLNIEPPFDALRQDVRFKDVAERVWAK